MDDLHSEVGSHRDGVAVEERRPNGDVFVALVGCREESGEGDLLAAVGGVDVEAVVVDADAFVGVAGGEGDLDVGGEEVGSGGGVAGDVEVVDGGVLEDEPGFGGAEDDPDEEDDEEDENYEAPEANEEAVVALPPLMMVVRTILGRHIVRWRRRRRRLLLPVRFLEEFLAMQVGLERVSKMLIE